MVDQLSSISEIRSPYPDFQVELKIILSDERLLPDVPSVVDSLMASMPMTLENLTVVEDSSSFVLVGRDLVKTYYRTYKVAYYPIRKAMYVSKKGWK